MSDMVRVSETELLVIERLAAALEKAASVDEIKDVRDRAMAIQLYARKKQGGLLAAQSAGRVVTAATMKLSELYCQETSVRGRNQHTEGPDRDPEAPGKEAVAKAAGMDGASLRRLAPVVDAPKPAVEAAMKEIEARGDVVTPNALRVQLTAANASPDYDGDEWYTPPDIIEAVRKVMGGIDLDPASNAHAQKTVQATTYYTKAQDGLSKEWSGRVFCNPPYSMPLIEQFTDKLLSSEVDQAVYLVNNCTDSAWFHRMLHASDAVCFTRGRIAFLSKKGQKFQTRQGQAFFYLGSREGAFRKVFSDIGAVLQVFPCTT